MEELVSKTLLFDYFSGKVSPIQKKSIESWLAISENRQIYYQWLHEWETNNLQTTNNWQTAFETISERIVYDVHNDKPVEKTLLWRWMGRGLGFWMAAASVFCVLGVSGWLGADIIRYKTVEVGYGETKRYVLPDGSVVDLNANSSIRFPRFGFAEPSILTDILGTPNGRYVSLSGEGDFSVRHLPNHRPFVVTTGKGLYVNVLGTQFTVFSRARRTQVVLKSGKVELTMPTQHQQRPLMMKPGDLVVLDAQGKLAVRQTPHPEALSAWKQHKFSFEKTSLREIAHMLQENYGLSVRIDGDELANRTISGAFPAQNANELIQLVAELLQINCFRDNNTVTFTN